MKLRKNCILHVEKSYNEDKKIVWYKKIEYGTMCNKYRIMCSEYRGCFIKINNELLGEEDERRILSKISQCI